MSVDILEQTQSVSVARRQQVKILIIDDDEARADVLARRLAKQGFATMCAHSGQRGLTLARLECPKLVMLHLRVVDAEGLGVCGQLADDPATCAIPVIVLSGDGRPDLVRRCRAAGGHFFLREPYDPNVLLVLIRQTLA